MIRRSFVSDWGFAFEAFSSVFFVVEAFVCSVCMVLFARKDVVLLWFYVPLIWEHGMDVVTVGWHICRLMVI